MVNNRVVHSSCYMAFHKAARNLGSRSVSIIFSNPQFARTSRANSVRLLSSPVRISCLVW